jgi:hypothetical protein
MEPASTHLRAELAAAPAGKVRDALEWVGSMLGEFFQANPPETIDLIVSRRDSGAVIMRHTIPNTIEADFALEAANHDLERMTVAEFVAAWRPRTEPTNPEPPEPTEPTNPEPTNPETPTQ